MDVLVRFFCGNQLFDADALPALLAEPSGSFGYDIRCGTRKPSRP